MEDQLAAAQNELLSLRRQLLEQSQQIMSQNSHQRMSQQYPQPSSTVSVQKLTLKNYQSWKFQIKRALESRNLEDVVHVENDRSHLDFRYKDRIAQDIISGTLSDEIIPKVNSCVFAHDIWRTLQQLYDKKSETSIGKLINNLCKLKMSENENIDSYYGRVDQLVTEIRGLGELVTERYVISRILGGLPKKYQDFKRSWLATSETERTLTKLVDRLSEDEELMNEDNATASGQLETALFVKNADTKHKFNKRRQLSDEELAVKKDKFPCHICKRKGHWANECPEKFTVTKANESSNSPKTTALMAKDFRGMSESWFADSGATSHMSGDLTLFASYEEFDNPRQIFMGNENTLDSQGVGTVEFICQVGNKTKRLDLKNVLFVPGITTNLVSIGAATRNGARVVFEDEACYFYSRENEKILAIGNLHSDSALFKMMMDPIKQPLNISSTFLMRENRSIDEWHKALGHMSQNQIVKMVHNKSANGINIVDNGKDNIYSFDCSECPMGKGIHSSHPLSTRERAKIIGEIVHADLIGPITPLSYGGSKYILLFTDEFSNYRSVYMLKNKTETAKSIEHYIKTIEIETGKKMRSLWTDQGTELINQSINRILELERIQSRVSAAYTPQQNGSAERSNRTLIEMTRSMINASGSRLELWAEASSNAAFILNRTTSSSKGDTSPFEHWFRRVPNLENIMEFGLEVQILDVPRTKSKWMSKTVDALIIGHTERVNTYKCFIPETGEFRLSCDIIYRRHSRVERQPNIDSVSKNVSASGGPSVSIIFNEIRQQHDKDTNSTSNSEITGIHQVSVENNPSLPDRLENKSADECGDLQVEPDPMLEIGDKEGVGQTQEDRTKLHTLADIAIAREIDNQRDKSNCVGAMMSSTPLAAQVNSIESPVPPIMNVNTNNHDDNQDTLNITPIKRTTNALKNLNLKIFNMTAIETPLDYFDAIKGENSVEWTEAIRNENESMILNEVWSYVELPKGARPLKGRWVFKVKTFPSGEVDRFKARLVAKGFNQRQGIDVFETFASVVRYETVRLMFAIMVLQSLSMIQFDVTTAFLNGRLEESIYMVPPEGILCPDGLVLKLNKSLYGLKQSPRCWQKRFNAILVELGLHPTQADPCLYSGTYKGCLVYLIIYVDDGIAISKNKQTLISLVEDIGKQIKVKIVDSQVFVGFEIEIHKEGVRLHQRKFIESMLERYNMSNCSPVSSPMNNSHDLNNVDDDEPCLAPYREIVGSLNYCACVCRPDITFSVSVLSRHLHKPLVKHWTAAKRVLRYMKGSINKGISFRHASEVNIECYSDADWAGDTSNRKSTSGVMLLIADGCIIFKSKQQRLRALSTAEAEYTACNLATKEIIWIRTLLNELKVKISRVTLNVDNQAAIRLVKNPEFHSRTKHFDIRMHSIREHFQMKLFDIAYVPTKDQKADVLTKPLPPAMHKTMVAKIGLVDKFNITALLTYIIAATFVICGPTIEDPVVWRQTPTSHVKGQIDLNIQITFFNPCKFIFNNISGVPLIDNDLLYTCNRRFNSDIYKTLSDLHVGLVRSKRDGGLSAALTVGAFTALLAAKTSHKLSNLKEESKIRDAMRAVLGEQVQLLQQRIISSNAKTSARLSKVEKDAEMIANIVATQAQIADALFQVLVEIHKEKNWILNLKEELKTGHKVPASLLRRLELTHTNPKLSAHQSIVHGFHFDTETLYVTATVMQISHDVSIWKADPFKYTAVHNNELCEHKYVGPMFMLHNHSSNCIRPVEEIEIVDELIITEGCKHKPIKQRNHYEPVNCREVNNTHLVKPSAQYKHYGKKLYVNCQMHKMIVDGVKVTCPNYIFSADRDTTFIVDDFEFNFFRSNIVEQAVSFVTPDKINIHLGTSKAEFHSLSSIEIEELEQSSKKYKETRVTSQIALSKLTQSSTFEDISYYGKMVTPFVCFSLLIFIIILVCRSLCCRPELLATIIFMSMSFNIVNCISNHGIIHKITAVQATEEIVALQTKIRTNKCNGWSINEDYRMWESRVGHYAVSVACSLSSMSIACPCNPSSEFIPIVARNELNTVFNYKSSECHDRTNFDLYKDDREIFSIASDYLCDYATKYDDFPKETYGQLIASGCTLAKLAFNCYCHGELAHKNIFTDLLSNKTTNIAPSRNQECIETEAKHKEEQDLYDSSLHARFYGTKWTKPN